jgi:hypothetical protein
MVVIVHFEPSTRYKKGHISTSNIELGFDLTNSTGFGESVFLQGGIRKKRQDINDVGLKSIFHRETNLRRI